MDEAREALDAMTGLARSNMSEEGVDMVNMYESVIEILKDDPNITIDTWEIMKMGIINASAIACNLIDAEIARMKEEQGE